MSYDTLFDDLAIMDHPDEVRELEARTYKESYEEFVKAFWEEVPGTEPLQWNWHMSVICRELEILAQGVFQGLNRDHDTIVNISPGTSKSSLISILYPTWIWANMPNARILSASHTDDLVIDLANKSRYVIKSKRYQELFPHVQIRPDQDSKGYYANTCGGDRYTCTVAGKSPMGFHAHFLICDDPIDPKKAVSEVELKTAKDFFDNVFPSRKVNKQVSVTILVMQRLHEEDPTGHWLKKSKRQGAAKLTHIKLPAELEKNDDGTYSDKNVNPPELADNYVDGLMDPVRLPLSVLNERKTDGIYAYSGQYLQNPVPVGGGMFKNTYFLQRTKAAPYHADRVFYIDRASTEDGGCYTAGVLLAKDKDRRLFVEWVMHGQWEPYERNQRILAAARRFRSRYGPRNEPTIHIEREGGASGKGDFQDIARLLMGFNVVEHNITGMGKKEFRAGPWSGQLAANNVWLVDNGESEGHGSADWDIENYIQEHVLFPKGKYKDQVDASCLTPDTLVQTFRGLVRIDSVTSSDLVLTREGYRRVKWAGQTGEVHQLVSVLFSDGSKLTGTYDHPVWTQALGFVRLGELSGMDSIVTNQTFRGNVKWSEKTSMSMKRLVTRGCVTEEDFQTESISGVRGSLYIEQSGRNISEVFPISMMFITRTGTHSTIRLKILNVSQSLSIDRNIERRTELRSNWHTSKEYAHWLYSGINLLREDYGISNMVKTPGLIERVNYTPAKFASVCFRQGAQYPLNTAHRLVMKRNDGQSKDVGITQKNVNYVTQTSLHKKVVKDFAAENVWQDTGFPVFNIKVDGPPEFFANNILVHNSGGLIVLSEERPAVGMRVLSTRGDRNKELRIYTTDRKELCETIIEEPSLFISLSDHYPLGNAELPPHAIQILVDSLVLQFSDIQPEDKQDSWGEIVHPYELEPEKLIMTRDHAKKLWAFLTKKRSTQATAIVIQDDLDRRAISMAMGIAEILGKKPENVVFSLARADIGVGKKAAPNAHVYQMTKTGRSLVV